MQTISFYSYKGGTGRTLLLANIGVLAARLGLKVVAIDLDLEAPGLPYKLLPDGMQRPDHPGVLDWLTTEPRPTVDQLGQPIRLHAPFHPGGSLTLITAGPKPSLDYMNGMRDLQTGPLVGEAGPAVAGLLALQQAVEKHYQPDLLLLDSRTGITTTNAITTRVLADDVVALTLGTPEQLDGTRAVLRSLVPLTKPKDDAALGLYVVVSRITDRPAEVGTYELSEREQGTIGRVTDFLTEPALPISTTVTEPQVLLLHNDAEVAEHERLLLARDNALTSTALHIDYLRIAGAVLGDRLDTLIDTAMADANPTQRQQWATFFARTDLILTAQPVREGQAQIDLYEGFADATPAERVTILRSLVTAQSDETRTPLLAEALIELAEAQRSAGDEPGSIANLREAAALLRKLSDHGFDSHWMTYVRALNALSDGLSHTSQHDEALAVAAEAMRLVGVGHRRGAGRDEPAAAAAAAAASLFRVGLRYWEGGDPGAGLKPLEDAVSVYEELTLRHPNASLYRPDLAASLNILGMINADVGFTKEAEQAAIRSVEIWQSLSEDEPGQYNIEFARALGNLGAYRRMRGQLQEAANATHQALSIYREYAYKDPDRYLVDLASALESLATTYGEMGQVNEALKYAEEALHFRRDLVEADPQRYMRGLVATLNSVSAQYIALERFNEAAALAFEAVSRSHDIAPSSRATKKLLAAALSNLTVSYVQLDDAPEALPFALESVSLYESIARTGTHWERDDFARSLLNISFIYEAIHDHRSAISSARSASTIYQELAADDLPTKRYAEAHANALIELSRRLCAAGEFEEAATVAKEAEDRYRDLAVENLDRYLPRVATALEALSMALRGSGNSDEARTTLRRVQNILKQAIRPQLSKNRHTAGIEEDSTDAPRGIWPRIEVEDLSARRESRLVLENYTDSPAMDLSYRYENGQGELVDDFDLLWNRHNTVEILAPRGVIRFPIFQAFGSPDSVLCVIEWTDARGVRRETRATVRIS